MKMTREEHIAFLYDENNEYCCSRCPENMGLITWQNPLPCGQQNCWVVIHIDSAIKKGLPYVKKGDTNENR